MKAIKLYKVSTQFSSREINARSRKEAIIIFKAQMKGIISENDKLTIK